MSDIYTPLIIISQNLFDRMLKESVAYPAVNCLPLHVNEDGKVITVVMNRAIRKRHITYVLVVNRPGYHSSACYTNLSLLIK
jgi:hypothetical protein